MILEKGHTQIAVLIDPDKISDDGLKPLSENINHAKPDMILIGGSTYAKSVKDIVIRLKQLTQIPILLFPGNNQQFCPNADGILLLSLISGRNPDFLIGQHFESALEIKHSSIHVIPTGYILIDGGKKSAVQTVSNTQPLPSDQPQLAIKTALAGELLGMKVIYLEAGSGALRPVPYETILAVKREINIPLIVGGGIRNCKQINSALEAGADIIVIGNHFEKKPDDMECFCNCVHNFQ